MATGTPTEFPYGVSVNGQELSPEGADGGTPTEFPYGITSEGVSFGTPLAGGTETNFPFGVTVGGVALSAVAGNFKVSNTTTLLAAMQQVVAGTARSRFVCEGSSATAGSGAGGSSYTNNGHALAYPALFASTLDAAGVRANQDSMVGLNNNSTVAAYQIFDTRNATVSGVAAVLSSIGFGGVGWRCSTTGPIRYRFTPVSNVFNRAEIYCVTASSTRQIDVYGGTGSTAAAANPVDFTILDNDVETQVITMANNSTVFEWEGNVAASTDIFGVTLFNSTQLPVSVLNCGIGSATLADRSVETLGRSSGRAPVTCMSLVTGSVKNVFFFDPSTINDSNAGTNLASWTTNIQTELVKRQAIGDVVLVIMPQPDVALYDTYADAAIALARDTMDIPWLDFRAIYGSYAAANAAGAMRDTLHPNNILYAQMGAAATAACIALL